MLLWLLKALSLVCCTLQAKAVRLLSVAGKRPVSASFIAPIVFYHLCLFAHSKPLNMANCFSCRLAVCVCESCLSLHLQWSFAAALSRYYYYYYLPATLPASFLCPLFCFPFTAVFYFFSVFPQLWLSSLKWGQREPSVRVAAKLRGLRKCVLPSRS